MQSKFLKHSCAFICLFVAVSALSACGYISANENRAGINVNVDNSYQHKKLREEVTDITDTAEISKILVRTDVGNVKVKLGETENIQVETQLEISYNDKLSDENAESLLDESTPDIDVEDNVLSFKSLTSASKSLTLTDKSIIDWFDMMTESNNYNISCNVTITVPASITDFEIETDVGNVVVDGVSGKYNVSTDVGNIDVLNIAVSADSTLSADVGNITASLADNTAAAKLDVSSDVGDISFDLGGLEYDVKYKDGDNAVSESASITTGALEITAKTDVGKFYLK